MIDFTAHPLFPDLLENQRRSVQYFFEKGILEELELFSYLAARPLGTRNSSTDIVTGSRGQLGGKLKLRQEFQSVDDKTGVKKQGHEASPREPSTSYFVPHLKGTKKGVSEWWLRSNRRGRISPRVSSPPRSSNSMELIIHASKFVFKKPQFSQIDAIRHQKTYSAGLYIPVEIRETKQPNNLLIGYSVTEDWILRNRSPDAAQPKHRFPEAPPKRNHKDTESLYNLHPSSSLGPDQEQNIASRVVEAPPLPTSVLDTSDTGLASVIRDRASEATFGGGSGCEASGGAHPAEPLYNVGRSSGCEASKWAPDASQPKPPKPLAKHLGYSVTSAPRWFYFGDIPLMTERGSFLINGAPRVLVNQIVRCPSVYFKLKLDEKNRRSYIASFLSDYGSWLRLETDRLRPRLWVRIDKSPRFPIELLLTSLGFGGRSDASQSSTSHPEPHTQKTSKGTRIFGLASARPTSKRLQERSDVADASCAASGGLGRSLLAKHPRGGAHPKHLSSFKRDSKSKVKKVLRAPAASSMLRNHRSYATEASAGQPRESIQLIWKKCNPGRWGSLVGCYSFFYNKFFNPRRYSLGRVGRLRLNKRLGRSPDCTLPTLTPEDVLLALDYLIDLQGQAGEATFGRLTDLDASTSSTKSTGISGASEVVRTRSEMLGRSRRSIEASVGAALHLKFTPPPPATLQSISRPRPLPHLDDIDHLKNRRVRLPGEIIQNQFRLALSRVLSPSSASLSRAVVNSRSTTSGFGYVVSNQPSSLLDQNISGGLPSVLVSSARLRPSIAPETARSLRAQNSEIHASDANSRNHNVSVGGGFANLDAPQPSQPEPAQHQPASVNFTSPPPSLASLLGGSPPSAFVSTLRELFNTSQLSQYMDQTNPLAEITHKRRLSSLGPGGVGRDQAGFAVREIHPSHFGRICPIETPEGQNAGLVGSLASYARISENGFLQSLLMATPTVPQGGSNSHHIAELKRETASRCSASRQNLNKHSPLLRNSYLFPAEVEDEIYLCTADIGQAIESVLYPTLQEQEGGALSDLVSSSCNSTLGVTTRIQGYYVSGRSLLAQHPLTIQPPVSSNQDTEVYARARRRFLQDPVPMRYKQEFITTKPNRIQFRGICPVQMISVATSLIPFLEHDDANRALMGSNMQRQAVPLMLPEKPLLGTGFELQAARDSSTLLLAPKSGYVTAVDSRKVELDINRVGVVGATVAQVAQHPTPLHFDFLNYSRSNQSTCIRQRPAVQIGEWVEKGDLLADGSATQDGELALGKNILLAYIPWEGYNFEDALVINERLVYEDIYSSLHIERYELDVRNISPIQFRTNDQTGALDPCLPAGVESHMKLNWPPTVGTEYITRDLSIIRGIPEKGFDANNSIQGLKWLGGAAMERSTNHKASSGAEPRGFAMLRIEPAQHQAASASSRCSASSLEHEMRNKDGEAPLAEPLAEHPSNSNNGVSEARPPIAATLYDQIRQLDQDGIVKPGVWVEEGSILVGKLTAQVGTNSRKGGELVRRNGASGRQTSSPRAGAGSNTSARGSSTPEYRLLLAILGNEGTANYSSGPSEGRNSGSRFSGNLKQSFIRFQNTSSKAGIGVRGRVIECIVPWRAQQESHSGATLVPRSPAVSKNGTNENSPMLRKLVPPDASQGTQFAQDGCEASNKFTPPPNSQLPLQIFIAHKKRIQVGDKMSGRHGNKGILSLILPPQDMPYLQDGTPVDIILNPLGVPSRMNVGQVLETLFGLAAKYLGEIYRLIPFEPQTFDASSSALRSLVEKEDASGGVAKHPASPSGARNKARSIDLSTYPETPNLAAAPETARSLVYSKLREARRRTGQPWLFDPNNPGKMQVFDGRTGEVFHQPLLVGYSYMFKLIHLVDDKIHARSTGPYSLVTQQPLGGRSKKGGQRLGEMEVWACEGFGAAYLLQEFLTVKSDEIYSRNTFLLNLMKRSSRVQISARWAAEPSLAMQSNSGDTIAAPPSSSPNSSGKSYVPESFRVLVNELQALCLSIYYNPDFRLSYPSLLGREGRLPGLSHLDLEN